MTTANLPKFFHLTSDPFAQLIWDEPGEYHGHDTYTWTLVSPVQHEDRNGRLLASSTRFVAGHVITHSRRESCACRFITISGRHVRQGFPGEIRPEHTEPVRVEISGLPTTGHWRRLVLPTGVDLSTLPGGTSFIARRNEFARPYLKGQPF